MNPDEVADREFPVVMRGYAREDVDVFLATVADQIADRDARLARLEVEMQRLRASAAAPQAVLPVDRRALIGQLGEEAASILAAADASAERIKTDALNTALRVRHDLRSIAGSLGDVHQLLGELIGLIHGLAEAGQDPVDELRIPGATPAPLGGDLPGQEVRTIFGEVLGLDAAAPAEIHLPSHDTELRRFSH